MNFFHLFLFRGYLSSFKKGDRRVRKSLQFFNYQSLLKFYSFIIYYIKKNITYIQLNNLQTYLYH